jgi:hypothetical protein
MLHWSNWRRIGGMVMFDVPSDTGDLRARQQIALDRITQLTVTADRRSSRDFHHYFGLQMLTIALAALTPCLIFLARDDPQNDIINWLQLFFPALAAVTAGLTHLFRWREDGVLYANLAESMRGQLWQFQTRSGEYANDLSEEQALDRLVTRVDALNLQSVARWASDQLTDAWPNVAQGRA